MRPPRFCRAKQLLDELLALEQLFRATEARRPHPAAAPTKIAASMSQDAQNMQSAPNAMRRDALQGGMRFDLDGWLARFGLTADATPGLSAQLQMQHAVLPLAPVDAIAAGSSAGAYLQALLMDPVYQLK